MVQDVEAAMSAAFVGRACRVIRREFDWVFFFEEHRAIVVTTPWRVVVQARVAIADADHGHRFGLPEPVDVEARANSLLAGLAVETLTVDPQLSDLALVFAKGVAVQLFNISSGYEAWQAEFPAGGEEQIIIGLGGGGVSAYTRRPPPT